jgi:hypothetical protein
LVRRPARPRPGAPCLHRRDLGFDQHGATVWTRSKGPAFAGWHPPRTLEDHHLRGWAPHHRPGRALCPRRPDQPRCVRDLRRQGSRSRAAPRRRRGHGQPVEPQGAEGAQDDRGSRREPALPSVRQPEPKDRVSDFHPIENAFAKRKALLRKAAERTIEGLWTAIGGLLETFTPDECANSFAAAGYDAT